MSSPTSRNSNTLLKNGRVTGGELVARKGVQLGAGQDPSIFQQSSEGFTLIEILLACAILALVMTLGYMVISQTIRGKEKVEKKSKAYHFARVAIDKLTSDISMAFLATGEKHLGKRQGSEQMKTVFKGDETSMTFTSLSHRRLFSEAKESEATEIGYKLEKDEENRDLNILLRREAPAIDKNPDEGGKWFPLAEGVKEVEFEFYDGKEQDWRGSWSSETDAPLRLPRAVRITLTVENPLRTEEVLTFRSIALVGMYANPIDF